MSTKALEAHLRVLALAATSTCGIAIRTHLHTPPHVCRKPPQPGRGRGRPRKAKA